MPVFENLGFNNHPFSKTNADEEPNLEKYFVPPPFFDAIVGDSSNPSASIVFAPRGGGKTAQRRMVEKSSAGLQFLAVTYDRFEFSADENLNDINLQYHLRNIITRILISYLSYMSDYPDLIKNLTEEQKKQLSIFAHCYLGDLTGDRLQEHLKELKSLPEKFKSFWQNNVGFLEPIINYLLKTYDLKEIDLPNVRQEEKRLTETYKYQLEILFNLVKKLGFQAIYLLIDRPDETEKTGNNPEATYRLIQPLIKDLELLGLDGYGFKFFLWDQIEKFHREDARPDRILQYKLTWKRSVLQNVLSLRLKAFSANHISTFKQLMECETEVDVDEAICLMSNGSPRNLIRICERIFTVHAENNPDSKKIDFNSIDRGILDFCEMLFKEIYGEDLLRIIQRVGRELFTTNYVANDILKITTNSARNKITNWVSIGLVHQVGTVSVPYSNKPVNFYCFVDPIAVRLIHRTIPFDKFLYDRWIPCNNCASDNLIDINLYPEGNSPLCRECGRVLVSQNILNKREHRGTSFT